MRATSAGIVRVRRVVSQHICGHTLVKSPTRASCAIIVRVRRVISQHICEHTLGNGPTRATCAIIVRVRRVVSQAISDEGTMETICDDDDVMEMMQSRYYVRVEIIAHKNYKIMHFVFCVRHNRPVSGCVSLKTFLSVMFIAPSHSSHLLILTIYLPYTVYSIWYTEYSI